MRDKPFDPHRLDVNAFARAHGHLDGHAPLAGFTRLAESVQPGAGQPQATWSVHGSFRQPAGREPLLRLRLQVSAEVVLTCQRCLEPLYLPLSVDRQLRFVASEAQAEELDEQIEEEDVLALTARLDLFELIEDELILALPIVPRHETCPIALPALASGEGAEAVPPGSPQPDDEAAPHPFAVLAGLRKSGGGS
jgi:uncharacterized protein